MKDSSITALRRTLLSRYEILARRLTRRLGSADQAAEALQDTFLKLERTKELGPVRNPEAYLLRVALNMAGGRDRAERRRLKSDEIDALLGVADPLPDPETVIIARSELDALRRVLADLPARQCDILLRARVGGETGQALADRYGVTTRTIELELRRALDFCAARIDRKVIQRFGPPRRAASSEEKGRDPVDPQQPQASEGSGARGRR
jgi:RNA polymerase sigma factor (sigma-70 family)